jgi:hypothetical protein
MWNDCESDSFGRCLSRHSLIWLHWLASISNRKPQSYPHRLYEPGDFNVELGTTELRQGSNTLSLTIIDDSKVMTTVPVEVSYTKGQTWPLPYAVDWKRVADVSQAVQIIDGRWTKTPEGLRTAEIGYDRLFAVGDLRWKDYEVTVPIKINAIDYAGSDNPVSGGSGFGIITHWRGHSFDTICQSECSQPRCGWLATGATEWYSFGSYNGAPSTFQIQDIPGPQPTIQRVIELDTWYVWKTRTERLEKQKKYKYRMKYWRRGEPEPTRWDLEGVDGIDNSLSGSVVFDAHHVDATFGNISIVPGPFKGQ